MTPSRAPGSRKLGRLGNISWLTTRQQDKLAGALTVSSIEKHGVISEEKNSPELVYVLFAEVAK